MVRSIWGTGDKTDGTVIDYKTTSSLLSRVLGAILQMTSPKSRIGRIVRFTRVFGSMSEGCFVAK